MRVYLVELDTVLPLSEECVEYIGKTDIVIIYDPDNDEVFHGDKYLANLTFISKDRQVLVSLILRFWMDAYLTSFIREVGNGETSNSKSYRADLLR